MKLKLTLAAAALVFSANGAMADFVGGRTAYLAGDYQLAYIEFAVSARQGDAKSQVGLGLLHTWGQGTQRDLGEAYTWFHVAATQDGPVDPVVRVLAETNRNYVEQQMSQSAVERALENAWDFIKREAISNDEVWDDLFAASPAPAAQAKLQIESPTASVDIE